MTDLGFVEGRYFVIEFALKHSAAQMADAAAELALSAVDVIVASGTPSVVPARDAAGRIPVVFVATLDPVATGLVKSLAKPGGSITGMTSVSGDVIAKRLEMTRELLRTLTRIAILVRDSSPTAAQMCRSRKSRHGN
jgi:putative tryptophan/tyrosine transport system substrate-binding protein